MRFATLSAALAFVASAIAQTAGFDAITSPTQWEKVAAGKAFTIKWQPGDVTGTVTIGLIGGVAQNKQVPLSTIAGKLHLTYDAPPSFPSTRRQPDHHEPG